MALIEINTRLIVAALLSRLPNASDKERMVRGLMAAGIQFWKKQAQRGLHSSSRDYIAGLSTEYADGKATLILHNENTMLPHLIENGFKGGDMRDWMLEGAKMGPNGRYKVIPFRHGTPGTGGRNVGAPMPGAIHESAKLLKATLSRHKRAVGTAGGATTLWGQRLNPNTAVSAQARTLLGRKSQTWHATSIHMNMVRKEKRHQAASQTSGYQTFRTISEGVIRGERDKETGKAKQHWFHPGIRPRRFAVKTARHIEGIAAKILANVLSEGR